MMKVLLINGSPHKEGCTFTALKEIASVLAESGLESEIIWLGKEPYMGCQGCGACGKLGHCVFDDLVNRVAARVDEFDGFVFGSPVHYAAASGAITSFMDRLFYSAGGKFAGKPGVAIVSARRGGTTAALEQLNKYFPICRMPMPGSQYWNMVHGNTPDEVRQDLEGLQTMRTVGRELSWLIKCLAAGRAAGIERPQAEDKVRTNFIH